MQPLTPFIWQNGNLVPWEKATTHVLSHGLHYGSGAFEGIRCYKTAKGTAIFKLKEHVNRLFYSAEVLGMKMPFSKAEIIEAIIHTVRENKIEAGYIRPLVYYGHGPLRVVPDKSLPIEVIIACWPWGKYLSAPCVDIQISRYIRIHPRSTVADAKICGHYVNSMLAGMALQNTHYHEALLLDAEGYVAEGSAENIFVVKNKVVYTTPTGTILEGITRNTVIEIIKMLGYELKEERFKPEFITQADEAFFTGTAVEVTGIRSLDDQIIATGTLGEITQQVQVYYHKMVTGQIPPCEDALTWI